MLLIFCLTPRRCHWRLASSHSGRRLRLEPNASAASSIIMDVVQQFVVRKTQSGWIVGHVKNFQVELTTPSKHRHLVCGRAGQCFRNGEGASGTGTEYTKEDNDYE